MERWYRYLIPVAAALVLVFSLGFFFGRRSTPSLTTVEVSRAASPEPSQSFAMPAPEPVTADPAQPPEEAPTLVNINTATVEELVTLPGIGAVLADRIIEYRQEYGRFVTTEQLMDVSGIGEQRYAELAPLVTVGESK